VVSLTKASKTADVNYWQRLAAWLQQDLSLQLQLPPRFASLTFGLIAPPRRQDISGIRTKQSFNMLQPLL
jgi:hypothetical protein